MSIVAAIVAGSAGSVPDIPGDAPRMSRVPGSGLPALRGEPGPGSAGAHGETMPVLPWHSIEGENRKIAVRLPLRGGSVCRARHTRAHPTRRPPMKTLHTWALLTSRTLCEVAYTAVTAYLEASKPGAM